MPLQSDSKGCYRTSFHTLQSPMQTLLKPFQFVEKSLEMSQVCYNGWSSSYWTKRALIYSIIHPPPTSLSFGGTWFIIFRCLGLAKLLHIIFFWSTESQYGHAAILCSISVLFCRVLLEIGEKNVVYRLCVMVMTSLSLWGMLQCWPLCTRKLMRLLSSYQGWWYQPCTWHMSVNLVPWQTSTHLLSYSLPYLKGLR